MPLCSWEHQSFRNGFTLLESNLQKHLFQLILYKVLHRIHFTEKKMFKMGFASETYSHCTQNNLDNYVHTTWHCTPNNQFWKVITKSLSLLLGCQIPLSPSLCLLGDISTISLNMKNNIWPCGSNYYQVNFCYEKEIKEHHTYYTLETLIYRLHLYGKCIHIHQKRYNRSTLHLAILQ